MPLDNIQAGVNPYQKSTDLMAGAYGGLTGANNILNTYLQYKLGRNAKLQDAQDNLNIYKQKLPLEQAKDIAVEKAKNQDQLSLERAKDMQMGSDFDPYTIKTLSLDPNKTYRISAVNNAMNNTTRRYGFETGATTKADLLQQKLDNQNALAQQANNLKENMDYQERVAKHPILNSFGQIDKPIGYNSGVQGGSGSVTPTPTVNPDPLDAKASQFLTQNKMPDTPANRDHAKKMGWVQ